MGKDIVKDEMSSRGTGKGSFHQGMVMVEKHHSRKISRVVIHMAKEETTLPIAMVTFIDLIHGLNNNSKYDYCYSGNSSSVTSFLPILYN